MISESELTGILEKVHKNKISKERLTIFHSEFREDFAYRVKIDRKVAL